jgi:hypothetical protein
MATYEDGDWRELFDVALFEPNRSKMRQSIERATHAIQSRLDALRGVQNEPGQAISENIALRDALATLAKLQQLAHSPRPSARVRGEDRAAG